MLSNRINNLSELKKLAIVFTLYYFFIFLSPSTFYTFLLSGILFIVVSLILKNIKYALILLFLITLPFAQGKRLGFILIPKDLIEQNSIFDIQYSFPLYIADVFLYLLIFINFRGILINIKKVSDLIKTIIKKENLIYLIYIAISLSGLFSTLFPEVIFLSSLQLVRLLIIFNLGELIINNKKLKNLFPLVIISSLIFQSLWAGLQFLYKSPLHKSLEVYLPGTINGIVTVENNEIFRVVGTFFEPSILGTFLVTNSLFLLFYLNKLKKLKTAAIIAILGSFFIALLTASRGIYLSSMLGIILFVIFKIKDLKIINLSKIRKNILLKISLLIPVLTIVTLLIFPYLKTRFETFPSLFSKYGSGTYRVQMSIYAFRLASNSLNGVGTSLSPYFLATSFKGESFIFDPTYPHNIFAQILAENGALGLLTFITFLYSIYRTKIIKKKVSAFDLAALAFLLNAQFYPIYLNHPEIISYLFLYLGLSNAENYI